MVLQYIETVKPLLQGNVTDVPNYVTGVKQYMCNRGDKIQSLNFSPRS